MGLEGWGQENAKRRAGEGGVWGKKYSLHRKFYKPENETEMNGRSVNKSFRSRSVYISFFAFAFFSLCMRNHT